MRSNQIWQSPKQPLLVVVLQCLEEHCMLLLMAAQETAKQATLNLSCRYYITYSYFYSITIKHLLITSLNQMNQSQLVISQLVPFLRSHSDPDGTLALENRKQLKKSSRIVRISNLMKKKRRNKFWIDIKFSFCSWNFSYLNCKYCSFLSGMQILCG